MGMHGGYDLGPYEGVVTEPDGTHRAAEPADSLMHINDDGTVTIPDHVNVYDVDGILAFRTPRLQGWANHHPDSPIIHAGGQRPLKDAVVAELARQGRGLMPYRVTATRPVVNPGAQFWDIDTGTVWEYSEDRTWVEVPE